MLEPIAAPHPPTPATISNPHKRFHHYERPNLHSSRTSTPASTDSSQPSGSFAEPFSGPTVPFPALLLDHVMPRLTDTEWRLLCVVVRQTLGWQDKNTGGRKQKDWLTQAQLTARTGRTAKPVAQAIAALIAKQLIRVISDQGEALLTPEQRRRYPGRHWFQLHSQWTRIAEKTKVAEEKGIGAGAGTATDIAPNLRSGEALQEDKPQSRNSQSESSQGEEGPTEVRRQQGERARSGNMSTDLVAEACEVFTVEKLHTTKETEYKYIDNHKHTYEKWNNDRELNNEREFSRIPPSNSLQRTITPNRESGSVPPKWQSRVSDRTSEKGSVMLSNTTFNPLPAYLHAVQEQEATGQRWRWRKDIAKWVSCVLDENSETAVSSNGSLCRRSKDL